MRRASVTPPLERVNSSTETACGNQFLHKSVCFSSATTKGIFEKSCSKTSLSARLTRLSIPADPRLHGEGLQGRSTPGDTSRAGTIWSSSLPGPRQFRRVVGRPSKGIYILPWPSRAFSFVSNPLYVVFAPACREAKENL